MWIRKNCNRIMENEHRMILISHRSMHKKKKKKAAHTMTKKMIKKIIYNQIKNNHLQ